MILIDSDILIEVMRGRNRGVTEIWERLIEQPENLGCSPVSIAEIWHGARPGEQRALARLFQSFVCVPIDEATGRRAGEYMARFSRSHGLQLGDALIAASASITAAELWTRNRKHFPMSDLLFFGG